MVSNVDTTAAWCRLSTPNGGGPHPASDPDRGRTAGRRTQGFDQALRFWLQFVHVPAGARVAGPDLYTPSLDRQGLVTIERRLGFAGPLDFDVHPTNVGHAFIAKQFESVWNGLNCAHRCDAAR